MKKRLPIIIIAVLVVVFAGLGFYSHQKSKIKYNTSYVNGNTAGNLYNAGLFCEKNGTVYFANPDDDYRLYSMDTNGNHLKKLSYDRVMYINADDHYVYYVRNNENNGTGFDFFSYARNSLCRIDQNGENTKILDKDPCLYASLVGNYIYYLHYDDKDATTLYKIGIDGKGRKKVYSPYIFTRLYTGGIISADAVPHRQHTQQRKQHCTQKHRDAHQRHSAELPQDDAHEYAGHPDQKHACKHALHCQAVSRDIKRHFCSCRGQQQQRQRRKRGIAYPQQTVFRSLRTAHHIGGQQNNDVDGRHTAQFKKALTRILGIRKSLRQCAPKCAEQIFRLHGDKQQIHRAQHEQSRKDC